MSTDLGTAHGSVVIDAVPALAALAALRRESANTVGALNTSGRAAITAGTGLAAVGVGIGLLFKTAVEKSMELEKRLSYISGITNINAQEMEKLRKVVIKLGQDSAYTANEVADGFTELAKAGASTEQMIGGMGEAMITLGQAADIPLDKAASALVSISSTYGLAADQSARIADVLSGAANASIISVEDMAVTFKYAGGVAANLGVSLEDTATAIAILGNAGIKGSTAGTSLRRIMLQLTPRTDKAAAAMKNLGIITEDGSNRFYDAQGRAKKLSEVFQILQDSMKDLNPEQQQKNLATIFGDRAINSAIALMKEGEAGFKEMDDTLFRSSAADVAAERLDNLAGAIEILKGTIDSAFINAGSSAQKPIQRLVEGLTWLINLFNNLPGPVQQAIVYVLLAIGVFSLLAGGILLTFGVMLRAGAVIIQMANLFKVLSLNLRLAAFFMRLFTISLLTNPIFLIIAAIIALGVGFYLLWTRSETFREGVKKLWATMKDAFWAMIDWFKEFPAHVDKAWEAVKRFFSGLWESIASGVDSAWEAVKGFFSSIGSGIADAFGAVVDWFASLPGIIGGALSDLGSGIWDRFMGESESAAEAMGYWVGRIITFIPGQIWKMIQTLWGLGVQAYHAVSDWVVNAYHATVDWFSKLPGRVAHFFGSMWDSITAWLSRTWSSATAWVGRTVTDIGNWFSQLPGRISNWMSQTWNSFTTWITNLWNSAWSGGGNIIGAITEWFAQLPGRVGAWMSNTWSSFSAWVGRTIDSARQMGSGIVNGITSFISGLPGTVSGIIGRVISAFTGMIGRAFNAAKDFAGGLWRGFKEGLGINSPSFIEEAMFAIEREGGNTIGALSKQVRTMQRLGAGLPHVIESSAVSGPTAASRSSFSRKPGDDAMLAGGNPVHIDKLEVNNPKPEPASDSLEHQVTKLVVLGV